MEMTVTVASTAAEPGSGVFLSTVHNKLYSHNQTYPAVKEQVGRADVMPLAWVARPIVWQRVQKLLAAWSTNPRPAARPSYVDSCCRSGGGCRCTPSRTAPS